VVLGVVGLPSAGAWSPSGPCWPQGSTTVKRTDRARVYTAANGRDYGCLFAVGRSFRLDPGEAKNGRPYALRGNYVAYRQEIRHADTGRLSVDLDVLDLRDGSTRHHVKQIFDHAGKTGINRIQATLPSLVLKSNGSVAWIAMVPWSYLRDVYRLDSRGVKLLDRDAQIQRHSLRLHGSQLSWIRDAKSRTADLK
jgi:hypothetical protein